jgi:hypothetical protein
MIKETTALNVSIIDYGSAEILKAVVSFIIYYGSAELLKAVVSFIIYYGSAKTFKAVVSFIIYLVYDKGDNSLECFS